MDEKLFNEMNESWKQEKLKQRKLKRLAEHMIELLSEGEKKKE